jgi:hypothetical protein
MLEIEFGNPGRGDRHAVSMSTVSMDIALAPTAGTRIPRAGQYRW